MGQVGDCNAGSTIATTRTSVSGEHQCCNPMEGEGVLNQVEPYQDRAPVRIRTSERHIEYRCDSTIMLLGQLGLLSARGSSPELGLLRAYSAHVLSKQITRILPEHGTSRMPVSVVKVCCSLELSGKLSTKQNRCLTRLRASMQTCQNA